MYAQSENQWVRSSQGNFRPVVKSAGHLPEEDPMSKTAIIAIVAVCLLAGLAVLGLLLGGGEGPAASGAGASVAAGSSAAAGGTAPGDRQAPPAGDAAAAAAAGAKADAPAGGGAEPGQRGGKGVVRRSAENVAGEAVDTGHAIKDTAAAVGDNFEGEADLEDVGDGAKKTGRAAKNLGKSIVDGAEKSAKGVRDLFR
jgi:hypothetical protein